MDLMRTSITSSICDGKQFARCLRRTGDRAPKITECARNCWDTSSRMPAVITTSARSPDSKSRRRSRERSSEVIVTTVTLSLVRKSEDLLWTLYHVIQSKFGNLTAVSPVILFLYFITYYYMFVLYKVHSFHFYKQKKSFLTQLLFFGFSVVLFT